MAKSLITREQAQEIVTNEDFLWKVDHFVEGESLVIIHAKTSLDSHRAIVYSKEIRDVVLILNLD